jgi:hypothetical protein
MLRCRLRHFCYSSGMSEYEPQPNIPTGLTFVSDVSWDEVMQSWKNDEDTDTFRREYTEQGYDTWESWRRVIIDPLHLDRLTWALYEVDDPLASIPNFRGGPFKPWEDMYYGGKKAPTFAEIVDTEGTDVNTRDKFTEINASNGPIKLIGLLKGTSVYIIEGMHRSTALALAAARGQSVSRPVYLLLARTDLAEFETIY